MLSNFTKTIFSMLSSLHFGIFLFLLFTFYVVILLSGYGRLFSINSLFKFSDSIYFRLTTLNFTSFHYHSPFSERVAHLTILFGHFNIHMTQMQMRMGKKPSLFFYCIKIVYQREREKGERTIIYCKY